MEDIEQQCTVRAEESTGRARIWHIPRPMMRERYVIHAFSGRRRLGDFQHFVEVIQQAHEGTTIHTISVDIVVDPIWGDVSRPEVRSFWLNAVKSRYVVGAMAGPPCETWSQARGKHLEEDGLQGPWHAPRVLRELDSIWGRASLALRGLHQLDIGNLLLLFALELLIHLALADGIGGLEHPAAPKDVNKASIWRLPLMAYLLSWPEFDFVEISQGLWGAPSKKPTGLLLLNMTEMVPQLRAWQTSSDVPRNVAIGLTKEGVWATSALKEYPPALCAGLAGGFVGTLQQREVDESLEASEDFVRQAQCMIVHDFGSCAGPDFAG
jgi:hypothetical protein